MNKTAIALSFFWIPLLLCGTLAEATQTTSLSLSVVPAHVIQGEPFMARIDGATSTASVKKMTFDGAPIGVFFYQGAPTALVGIDLNKKPGSYELRAESSDGQVLSKIVDVGARPKIETPFGIPAKLGGNTPASQKKLVTTLAAENRSLANLYTAKKTLWTEKFVPPLAQLVVTDEYGYVRKTGAYAIPHKGVDYRAPEGTPVVAMNRGVVRVAKTYRTYGKTVVIDHGLGLMSYYMHLSKINVARGQVAQRGQTIGLSGHTGYAEQPHLHLTVRINGSSIDPVKFLELLGP